MVEVACDESGFTGGNLTSAGAVFSHASILVPSAAAESEMERLRRRVSAHGELKASWLLRWCDPGDLRRLLAPDGLLAGGAHVLLIDIRLFLLRRLADVLLGTDEISGLDVPGKTARTRAAAHLLHRDGESAFGSHRWQEFLVTAGFALRTNSRWGPDAPVDELDRALNSLIDAGPPTPIRRLLSRLKSATDRVRDVRQILEADSHRPPLLEPLLPSLTRAVLWWGTDCPALRIVHDEQSALTPWRVSEIDGRLSEQHPGHVLDLVRVDSRDDPRVQVADLVAGIARRAAGGVLTGRPDPALVEIVHPLVDPASVWCDDSWLRSATGVTHVTAGLSPR